MSATISAPDGARRPAHGTAAAALRNRNFRTMWLGLFASNIGTWMQTLVLPAYIYERTGSGWWVGVFALGQMGPMILLSIIGGVLADKFPRKVWLIAMQTEQLVLSVVVAWLVAVDAHLAAIFVVQLFVGIGNALNAPAMQGTMPNLVDPRDVPGAISLNSVMINGSRVIGPVIAALLMGRGVTVPQIFLINAATFLFAIFAIAIITIPPIGKATTAQGWDNVLTGIRIARRRSILSRLLLSMTLFSLFSLPYVALFPAVASRTFHISSKTATYKWLYATWGLGACVGALSIGTVLAQWNKPKLVRPFFLGFAASMTAFALLRSAAPAFPVGFLLGFFYFGLATTMLTVLQQNLRATERARVMSLWFMAFGGTVGISGFVFGPFIDHFGPRPMLFIAAAMALGLSWWCDVARRPLSTLADEDATTALDDARRNTLEARRSAGLDEHGITAGE